MFLNFPLSIGLCGAPGSGKQKLVDEFLTVATPWFEENGSTLTVVPSPGTVIEQEYDQAMGAFGSYVEDLWAFFHRYETEQGLRKDQKSFISSSTVFDTIAHCGVNMEAILAGITTPDTEVRQMKQKIAMTALTFLQQDRFAYNFGFYLPYKQTVILPGQEDDFESRYNQRVDQGLQMVFANFGLRIQVLDQPTFEEKAQVMFETVKKIAEDGPPKPPEDPNEAAEIPEVAEDDPTPVSDTLAA